MPSVDLTPAKLADIKQKASECECKIWRIFHGSDGYSIQAGRNIKIADSEFLEDAEYIAAADPATVLAMVEEIERLRHFVRETLNGLHECYDEEHCEICKEIDRVIESEPTQ